MKTFASPTLKWLTINVFLYMTLALIAAGIAVAEDLPAEFAGTSTGLTAMQDFLYGMGTEATRAIYISKME